MPPICQQHFSYPDQVQNYGVGGYYNTHMDLIYKTASQEEVRQANGNDRTDTDFFYH